MSIQELFNNFDWQKHNLAYVEFCKRHALDPILRESQIAFFLSLDISEQI